MGIFNPKNFIEGGFKLPSYPPKGNQGVIEEYNKGWFPLASGIIEKNENFIKLSPSTKVLFWYLVSKYNYQGKRPFFKSDDELAAILNTSTKTIQRGRKKLIELGLITVQKGTVKNDNYYATEYLVIEGADTKYQELYAPMDRATFNTLLECLREGTIDIRDIVTLIITCYVEHMATRKGYDRRADIFKGALRWLTNLPDTPARLQWLSQILTTDSGEPLFEIIAGC